MKKLALFPMTRDQCAIARFSSLLQGYELVSLFIPPFLPFDGRDSNFLDKGQPTGMLLTHYSAEKLNMCDVLYIDYDDKYDLSLHKEVYEFAISQGKEVILTRELTRKLGLDHFTPCSDNTNEKLFDITIPVVTVFSQGKNSDQFATELALRQYFTDKGYRISHIGSNEASKFFNFVHVPKFLFDDSDAYMKIIRFNHYAKALIDQEKPDLLIIGAPDTIMKYNNNVLNGLGVLPFIVSSAVKADVAIATAYYNNGIYSITAKSVNQTLALRKYIDGKTEYSLHIALRIWESMHRRFKTKHHNLAINHGEVIL